MKDSLFDLLLTLFENTVAQLKKYHEPEQVVTEELSHPVSSEPVSMASSSGSRVVAVKIEHIQSRQPDSIRVFTQHEQLKLTKASQQCLVRMVSWGVLTPDLFELILNRLVFSDSRFVGVDETKWVIHKSLSSELTPEQLSFLELILDHRDDHLAVH